MFFDSASEERQHAIKLISYLLMRGELISDVSNLIDTYVSLPQKYVFFKDWIQLILKWPYWREMSVICHVVAKKSLEVPRILNVGWQFQIGVSKTQWESGVEALKDALQLEATVTKKIKGVVKVCEDQPGPNDYHLVDYLTGVFLEEQYTGQRDIAGKISTLDKFMTKHGALGEFLFDKKLLNGEL